MQDHEKHPHHHWLLAMLGGAITLLVVILGYFGYELFTGESIRVIERAEVEQTDYLDEIQEQQNDIFESIQEINEEGIEEKEEVTINTLDGTGLSPAFSYPQGWHIYSSSIPSGKAGYLNKIHIDKKPIQLLEGDVVFPVSGNTVSTSIAELGEHISYTDYVQSIYTEPYYTNISIESGPHLDGTLTTISGHQSGLFDANFEQIIFEHQEMAVDMIFIDIDPEATDNDTWDIIKNSLDFSTIQ
jgi:hypothetical protein